MATIAIQAGQILGKILGQKHQAAVAAEANNLNQAVPTYQRNLSAIVGALNSGQLDPVTAAEGIDECVSDYYSAVSGIISSGRSGGDCSNLSSNCNGPCTVGCDWVKPWASRIKSAISQGGGTVSFDAIPAHAGFQGLPAWSITVAPQSSLTNNAALSVGTTAVPSNVGGGVLESIAVHPVSPASYQTGTFSTVPSTPSTSIAKSPLLILAVGAAALFLALSSGRK